MGASTGARATALWRRLDVPGHDACRVDSAGDGWRLQGTAVFRDDRGPACLDYQVACDASWRTLSGRVEGWTADGVVDVRIARGDDGTWTLDGGVVPGLDGCLDLDFGFTPATNYLQLRRASLPVGGTADFPVAWFDVSPGGLVRLPQRYQRRSTATYWYESPTVGYAALLELEASGFVRVYPTLWEHEP